MTDGQQEAVIARAVEELGWGPARLVVARGFRARLLGMGAPAARRTGGPPPVVAFPRCRAVHTCFMARALDVAFIDDEGRVLAQRRALAPWRFVRHRTAWAVLERRAPGGAGPAGPPLGAPACADAAVRAHAKKIPRFFLTGWSHLLNCTSRRLRQALWPDSSVGRAED